MSTIINSCTDYTKFAGKSWQEKMDLCNECKCRYLARRMCEEDNCYIILASPDPSELPPPPQRWLVKDSSMVLLDAATTEALEHYWAGQVKACQYAIFHSC